MGKRASKKKKRKEASIDSLDNQTFEDEAEMAENGSKIVQSKLTLKEKKITTKRFSLESLSSTFSEGAVEDERQRNLTASSKKKRKKKKKKINFPSPASSLARPESDIDEENPSTFSFFEDAVE